MGKRLSTEEWGILDVNGWMARATLEMLGQAGLGYSFDSFEEDSTDAYGESLKLFLSVFAHTCTAAHADSSDRSGSPVLSRIPFLGFVVRIFANYVPEQLTRKMLRLAYPFPTVLRMLEIADTMSKRSKEIVREKKLALENGDQALAHQVGEGKDIMSILCEWTRLFQHRSFSKLSIDF